MHEMPHSLDTGPQPEGLALHRSPSDSFRLLHTVTAVVGVVAMLLVGGAFAFLVVLLTGTAVAMLGSNWAIAPGVLVLLLILLLVVAVCAFFVRAARQTLEVSTRGIRFADWRASHTLEWAEISEISAGPKNSMGAMPMYISTRDGRRLRASMPAFISMGSRHFTFGDYGGAGMGPSEYTPPMLAAQDGLARYRRGEFGR